MATAQQLKNLKPWPKGVSGNPSGKWSLPEDLKGIRNLSQLETTKIISKYARMLLVELNERLKDPKTPVLELAIASIFSKSIAQGDFMRLSFLLDRAIGKVPVTVESDEDVSERDTLAKLSMNELLTLVKENLPA